MAKVHDFSVLFYTSKDFAQTEHNFARTHVLCPFLLKNLIVLYLEKTLKCYQMNKLIYLKLSLQIVSLTTGTYFDDGENFSENQSLGLFSFQKLSSKKEYPFKCIRLSWKAQYEHGPAKKREGLCKQVNIKKFSKTLVEEKKHYKINIRTNSVCLFR